MKDGIHPGYHQIKVVLTDGSSFKTGSTYGYGKEGEVVMNLGVDPLTHPAWTGLGKMRLSNTDGQLSRFGKRYGSFGQQT